MRSEEDYKILEAMDRYGGGFVQALAMAGFHADDDNLERIKKAWPEYWAEYGEMARTRGEG